MAAGERKRICCSVDGVEKAANSSRGRWFQLRGVSTASRLPGAVETKSLSSLKEKTSEIPMPKWSLI